MAKFSGKIGFAHNVEIRKGVYDDVITERDFKGDLIRPSVKSSGESQINSDLTTGNSVSVILDEYLQNNLLAIRYVTWMGVRWSAKKVDVVHPRLTIALGEVYNGPAA